MLKRPSRPSLLDGRLNVASQPIAESITSLSTDAVRQPVERCHGASLLGRRMFCPDELLPHDKH
jgi:hypothetical protein